ncbi:NAD(P)/FAD-dependent oxidoreductase [Microlunatus soli]|uniref:NADH dehydrogenase n=1 Tax=Microlunatus soli TaxID=630515 RepID=A0A1H1UF28_9ACTN|nr:FAD-dependent oxidoreductase [Microlunatus soli]SDS71020.1 NADH dehydrogenase [Microlunatus soli]
MKRILIVGAGSAGFNAARELEKRLHPGEAEVTVVDPRPYMTYQPFLPEVAAGSIEARHAAVPLRRHLRRTTIVSGTVTAVDHAHRQVTVRPIAGEDYRLSYDIIAVTAGAVTRRFPVPGIADQAIGMKHVEEAVAIRDRLLTALDRAEELPAGPERDKLLTITFVGGGFAGVEGFGELLSLTAAIVKRYPRITADELQFHLVEASGRILPEVSIDSGRWVLRSLQRRGAVIHLNTQVRSAVDGHVELSDGAAFDSGLIVWTAGNAANPVVHRHTDLPTDERGRLIAAADLRILADGEPVPDAWAAGDDAAVPDLAADQPGPTTVPNAQHAFRQGKLLAHNLLADLRGRPTRSYLHHSLGSVATLGVGRGIYQRGPIVIKGLPAWLMHRGYHVLAVPSVERTVRVSAVWLAALIFGRDTVSLASVEHPRDAFVTGGEIGAPAAVTDHHPADAAHHRPSVVTK